MRFLHDFLCSVSLHEWDRVRNNRGVSRYECLREGCEAFRYEVEFVDDREREDVKEKA